MNPSSVSAPSAHRADPSLTPAPLSTGSSNEALLNDALLGPRAALDALQPNAPAEPRRMQPLRFAFGLLITTAGMGLILLVGAKMLEVSQIAGDFALGLVAIGVLTGVILLGGGFGLMATASGGFDEREFDQLLKAGNISAVASTELAPARSESHHPKSAA